MLGGARGGGLVARRLTPASLFPHKRTVRAARRLGQPVVDFRGPGGLLALTYSLGGLAVVIAWLVDPNDISDRTGMATLLVFVFAAAAGIYALRNRLPRYTGDAAVVGSLVLIDLAVLFTKLHVHPGLLSPFYVWVGFASPLWFPRRRAILYAFLALVASGIVTIVAGSAQAVAAWVITITTLVVAFCITSFLTDALVKRERLAVVGEMASVVGHELRNPLGVVSNTLFLLHHSLGEDVVEEQEQHFQMAEREIAKASAIIQHLRAYVRPEEPSIASMELGALVAEVLEVAPLHPGIEVIVDVAPITLFADRGQLAQVLTNLVANACDALGERGLLRVTASIKGRAVVIDVEDDGPGIEHSRAEQVFEPFYTTKHKGTGLGLAIVRRLVEAHGGTVRLESEPSRGARFSVNLPMQSLRRRRPGTSPGVSLDHRSTGALHIAVKARSRARIPSRKRRLGR
jgi:signal transduction histidine kinase